MDRIALVLLLSTCAGSLTVASPLERRDDPKKDPVPVESSSPQVQHEQVEDLVIVAGDLVPTVSNSPQNPVIIKDQEELIVAPRLLANLEEESMKVVGGEMIETASNSPQNPVIIKDQEELVVAPRLLASFEEESEGVGGGEAMETAASGIVFRPLFRYRSKDRRRIDRNPNRRRPYRY